jgi:hypothetical protein
VLFTLEWILKFIQPLPLDLCTVYNANCCPEFSVVWIWIIVEMRMVAVCTFCGVGKVGFQILIRNCEMWKH